MKLDRAHQREILELLAEDYPGPLDYRKSFRELDDDAGKKFIANLVYLEEHGLAISTVEYGISGDPYMGCPKITAAGMDFLADDGGLSAILGVVTIKLHEADLLALIGAKITQSDLTAPEKKKCLDGLRERPAESIKHLTMKLLDKGLENWPAALLAIQKSLQYALQ